MFNELKTNLVRRKTGKKQAAQARQDEGVATYTGAAVSLTVPISLLAYSASPEKNTAPPFGFRAPPAERNADKLKAIAKLHKVRGFNTHTLD